MSADLALWQALVVVPRVVPSQWEDSVFGCEVRFDGSKVFGCEVAVVAYVGASRLWCSVCGSCNWRLSKVVEYLVDSSSGLVDVVVE